MGYEGPGLLFEKILVDSLEMQDIFVPASDVVTDHQAREVSPVDQDNSRTEFLRRANGGTAKGGCCHEDTLLRFLQAQRAKEIANGPGANGVALGVALGLQVDLVNAEGVLGWVKPLFA